MTLALRSHQARLLSSKEDSPLKSWLNMNQESMDSTNTSVTTKLQLKIPNMKLSELVSRLSSLKMVWLPSKTVTSSNNGLNKQRFQTQSPPTNKRKNNKRNKVNKQPLKLSRNLSNSKNLKSRKRRSKLQDQLNSRPNNLTSTLNKNFKSISLLKAKCSTRTESFSKHTRERMNSNLFCTSGGKISSTLIKSTSRLKMYLPSWSFFSKIANGSITMDCMPHEAHTVKELIRSTPRSSPSKTGTITFTKFLKN